MTSVLRISEHLWISRRLHSCRCDLQSWESSSLRKARSWRSSRRLPISITKSQLYINGTSHLYADSLLKYTHNEWLETKQMKHKKWNLQFTFWRKPHESVPQETRIRFCPILSTNIQVSIINNIILVLIMIIFINYMFLSLHLKSELSHLAMIQQIKGMMSKIANIIIQTSILKAATKLNELTACKQSLK